MQELRWMTLKAIGGQVKTGGTRRQIGRGIGNGGTLWKGSQEGKKEE